MVGFSVIFCVEVDLRIIVDRLIFDISVFYVQLRTTVLFQVEIEKRQGSKGHLQHVQKCQYFENNDRHQSSRSGYICVPLVRRGD